MKNIYKIALFFALLLSVRNGNAQMTCLTPSLGVYDANTGAAMSAVISCTYANLINISPTQFAVGNQGTSPCIRIIVGLTNANAATNNSIAIGQGTNNPIISLCNSFPVPCYTFVPSSSTYTFSLFFMDPAQSHGYNLCNTNIAGNMNYTVASCYNSTPLASGVWNNGTAGGCQTVTIPANSAIGLAGYTVSPAVAPTASYNANTGDMYLDTYQMAQGVYTITYSFNSQNGCSIVQTRTISITNPYNSSWTTPTAMCANGPCVNLPPQITGTAGGTFTAPLGVSSTSFCPSIVGAGTYPVTYTVGITPTCGNATTNTITVNALPVANAGSTQSLTCVNITTVLAGSGGGTYSWSGPGIVGGGTTATPTVGTAGVYSLTVNSGVCSSLTSTVAVGFNTVAPSPTVSTTGSITCTNNAISLGSLPAGMTYTWTAPGGSSITGGVNSQSTTATGPGTYTVRVVNPANGCSTNTTIAANVNTVAPAGLNALTSGSITCNNTSINLTTTLTGVTYTWTAPGGGSITGGVNNQNTTGSGAGTYTIRVQSAVNGCTAQATVAALVNTVNPSPTAGTSGSITCNNTAITLTSTPSSGVTYTWTAPGGSSITGGVNSQNTTGSGAGTYTVRVTDAVNGCTNIATVAALINTTTPTGVGASATGSVTCSTSTVSLNSSPTGGGTYTWTAPGGGSITGGVNNQNTTGSGAGTYTVVYQSSVNGCTAQATAAVGFNTVAPTGISANTSGTVTCASTAINLGVTPTGLTYSWTAPAGSSITSGGTSSSATGSGGGTYSVIVTGTNGCSAPTAVIVANTNTTAPTQTAIASQSLTCSTSSVNITGNPSSGVLYSWLGTGIVGPANTQTVNVVISGNYTLVVTNTANSCTSSAVAVVGTNTTPPNALGSGSVSITCATPSVNLIGSASPSSCTVVWTGGVCAGATSYTASACSPGQYSMTVTNPANGCSSAAAVFTVVSNSNFPTATLANTGTITCINTSAQVVATTTASPVTYTWSGPGIVSGSSTPTINVNMGGVYTLTLTNLLNGCVSVITNSVTNDNAAVTPTTAASSTITCNTTTVNMTATVGAGTYTYNWSGPGIVGTNTLSSATSSLGGTYNVTVTNTTNGCVGTATLSVTSSTNVPTGVSINPASFTLSCATPTTALTATAVGASTYSWIAPATGAIISGATSATAGINGPGNYSVVVTGTNGCSAAAAIAAVSPNTLAPTFVLSNSSPSITCLTANPTVSVNITSTVGIGSYSWTPASGISGSATGSVVTFTTAGTYTGVITATNGCQSNAIVTVLSATNSPTFVAGTATASPLSCSNPTAIISPVYTPTTDITFVWSGPGIVGSTTGSSVAVNQNGTYSVIVTNTVTGCTSNSLTVIVVGTTIPPLLNVSSTSSVGLGCSPTNSTNVLTANATPTNVSYNWNTSATTPTILVSTAGVYTVTITDPATSCTTSVTYTVDNNTTVPTATSVANSVIPCGASTATLNGGSPDPGVTFSWTGPSIVSGSNTSTPVVDQPGTYILTVTNPTTGCTSTSTVTLINGVPTASFTPDVTTGFAPQVVNFTNLSSPSATVFTWTFGDGNGSSTTSPSNTYSVAGSYTVMMIASSGLCTDTAYAFITIEDGFSIEIPNVFTPNDDNVNDVFTIKSTGVKEIQLQVFNRWGQLMYDFTGAKAAWDGITSNGEKATDGTYFYFVIATGFDSTKEPVKKNGSLGLYR
ncbi:MAG: gliding motility-associated C-terminal domain-containing protein [Bacteroidia bacterium]|nr:gliding motility-associated C-terminal domain-containing protein [Bacteroidia bacterium]